MNFRRSDIILVAVKPARKAAQAWRTKVKGAYKTRPMQQMGAQHRKALNRHKVTP